ncbi:MAG: hypothetical protein ABIW38_00785, partial [Ferruginibacter sp.]
MKKNIIFPLIFLILSLTVMNQFAAGQAPHIHRQKCIGGTRDEYILYMIKLADGNYLSCGTSESQDADFKKTNHYGGYDAFLMKTDKAGNIIWIQNYGGNRDDIFYNVMETSTGDLIAIGTTGSNNGLVSGNHGAPGTDDVWLVKINKDGKFLQQHCYGGSRSESTLELGMSEGLMMDKDGNILFVGETNSNDGDVSGNHGDYDGWLVKVNSASFDIIKSKTIGTAAYDAAYNVFEIDGDIFVTGSNSKAAYTTTDALSVEVNGDGFATRINGT